MRVRQTVVIVVPTCYTDPDEARRAVEPYVRDMRVVARIAEVRDERPGDDGRAVARHSLNAAGV